MCGVWRARRYRLVPADLQASDPPGRLPRPLRSGYYAGGRAYHVALTFSGAKCAITHILWINQCVSTDR